MIKNTTETKQSPPVTLAGRFHIAGDGQTERIRAITIGDKAVQLGSKKQVAVRTERPGWWVAWKWMKVGDVWVNKSSSMSRWGLSFFQVNSGAVATRFKAVGEISTDNLKKHDRQRLVHFALTGKSGLEHNTKTYIKFRGGKIEELYTLTKCMGAGAHGTVWRGVERLSGKERAVKIANERDDAEHEHAAYQKMAPGYTELAGNLLFMPLLKGDLAKAMEKSVFTQEQKVALVIDLFGQLAEIHAKGVAHLDLATDNIGYDEEGRPHIIDPGCATWKGERDPHYICRSSITTASDREVWHDAGAGIGKFSRIEVARKIDVAGLARTGLFFLTGRQAASSNGWCSRKIVWRKEEFMQAIGREDAVAQTLWTTLVSATVACLGKRQSAAQIHQTLTTAQGRSA